MDIKSNDDGTWRRIRVCPFKSKFIESPDDDKFQFKIDKNLIFLRSAPSLAGRPESRSLAQTSEKH